MTNLRRKTWTEDDNRMLISMWPRIGSIVLIAMKLQRTSSSVQTQASRLGLPRRNDGNDRHRRKWTVSDIETFNKTIENHTDKNGNIHICRIADDMGRSVDAIATRLLKLFEDEENLFDRLIIDNVSPAMASPVKKESGKKTKIIDDRKTGKERKCMSCGKMFWSEGAHNRLCLSCKSGDTDSNWDW